MIFFTIIILFLAFINSGVAIMCGVCKAEPHKDIDICKVIVPTECDTDSCVTYAFGVTVSSMEVQGIFLNCGVTIDEYFCRNLDHKYKMAFLDHGFVGIWARAKQCYAPLCNQHEYEQHANGSAAQDAYKRTVGALVCRNETLVGPADLPPSAKKPLQFKTRPKERWSSMSGCPGRRRLAAAALALVYLVQ